MQQSEAALVSVVIVCWNAMRDLPICLASLQRQTYPNLEVIAVDNGSTDGTAEYIKSAQPWVRLLPLGANAGYAAGNNAGFALANGEYIIVLNPDTEADPKFVAGLVESVSQPGVGLATSRICFFDDRERVNACGNEIHVSGLGYCRGLNQPARLFGRCEMVTSVSGCAFVIRRDVLNEVGGFDEDYFLYVEDIDLSMRANLAGHAVAFAPDSVVYHRYSLNMTPRKFYLLERNRRLTLLKNLSRRTNVLLMPPVWMTGLLMWIYALTHGPAYLRAKIEARTWIRQNGPLVQEKRRKTQALRKVTDRVLIDRLTSDFPADQMIGPGLGARLLGFPVNLAYRLLSIPARMLG